MNALYILGAIGGIIVIIEETSRYLARLIAWIGAKRKEYKKYKKFYEKNHEDDDVKPLMGFKTEKEKKEEIEAMMARKG